MRQRRSLGSASHSAAWSSSAASSMSGTSNGSKFSGTTVMCRIPIGYCWSALTPLLWSSTLKYHTINIMYSPRTGYYQ